MSKVKILFFAADPLSVPSDGRTARLLLDEEVREIRQKVRAARHRDVLDFDARWATRTDDLLQALNETPPQMVHFSGHGGSEGLVLVGSDGRGPHRVDAEALVQLFEAFRGDIRVVVLSACFSLPQARAIAGVVGCAIGTRGTISDEAAITFGASFYRAIAFGHSVQASYDQARAALALEHFEDLECPQLVAGPGVEPADLFLIPPRIAGYTDPPGSMEDSVPRGPPRTLATLLPTSGRGMARARGVIAGLALTGAAMVTGRTLLDGRGDSGAAAAPRALVRSPAPPAASTTPAGPARAGSELDAAKDLARAGNHAAAFPLFKRAAEAGNAEAMGFLGIAYLRGQGTGRDSTLAAKWLRASASKGDPGGTYALASAYENGDGVSRSLRWARHWYRRAAKDKGHAGAMRSLGRLFEDDARYDSAFVWYEKAARAGSLDAMVDAGRMHEDALGRPRNLDEARRLYRIAADSGSPAGMFAVGRTYQDAVGVPRDYGLAREWYIKAAGAGSADAMNNLGLLYQNGWGVPPDREEAIRWYRQARDAGSRVAAGNLAELGAG